MNELVLWHVALIFLSAHIYIWDKNEKGKLRKIYIWFHNFTSPKEKKITESEKGFIYNQKTKVKIAFASVIAFILTVILILVPGATSIPMEIILFFTEVPTITIGLFAGILLDKLYTFIKGLITAIDKAENKESNTPDEVSDTPDNAKTDIPNSTGKDRDTKSDKKIPDEPKETQPTEPSQDDIDNAALEKLNKMRGQSGK